MVRPSGSRISTTPDSKPCGTRSGSELVVVAAGAPVVAPLVVDPVGLTTVVLATVVLTTPPSAPLEHAARPNATVVSAAAAERRLRWPLLRSPRWLGLATAAASTPASCGPSTAST